MTTFWDVVETVAPFVIPAAATIGGALISSNAATRASQAQAAGASQAAGVTRGMYDQARADFAPYRDMGGNALYNLASLMGVEYENAPGTLQDRYATAMGRFQLSPNYRWRQTEGVRALDRSAAARGRLLSGGQLRDVVNYGQNLAGNEYGGYVNRLAALSGVGQSAVGATGQLGATAGANIGNAQIAAGNATAGGYRGRASSYAGAINDLLKFYGYGSG